MDTLTIGLLLLVVIFLLLGSGIWVALSLMGVGLFALEVLLGRDAGRILATQLWAGTNKWSLTALPLFIWMGEILFRSRLPSQMFSGIAPWVGSTPGGLFHVNVLGSAVFAAVCGSSAATCATVGKISIPELQKRGYDDRVALGSLAASGTLGLMIPPSIIMIVYGVAAEVSISRLFLAGFAPALLLIVLFMAYISIWSIFNRSKMPVNDIRMSFKEKIHNSKSLIPLVLLIVFVIGSIYTGMATATEAAGLGVLGALVLLALTRSLTWAALRDSLISATMSSCMIVGIMAMASFLSQAMAFTGIPAALSLWIQSMDLSNYALLAVLVVVFIILGCFLDGISIIVLTAAIILPMIQASGIDMIWFGIFMVIIVEISSITPPVGFNLFVLQGMSGKKMGDIIAGTTPFFFLMLFAILIITIFPQIVLYPVSLMR